MTTDLREHLQTTLGGAYIIERELGGGGMARVFVAEETALGRRVVVKVLPPETSSAVSAERFRREVQLAARLQHPHIVPLLAAGESHEGSEAILYYTMPYVEGESLRDRLARETQLPIGEAVRIACEVADALDYAHRHGVVHRDIKPENILLASAHAVVADFGIARAVTLAAGGALTSTGLALGTPRYMSPEQAAAEREVDGRSDIYSLGVVLYEMLAGEPPFTGPTAQAVIARMFTEPAPSVRRARAQVAEVVEQSVGRALARVPADRFQTAAEMRAALEGADAAAAERTLGSVASAGAIRTPDETSPLRGARGRSWRKGLMFGGIALSIALASGAAWYRSAHHLRSESELAAERRVLVVPFDNATGDPSLAPLGRMAADWVAQGLAQTGLVEVTTEFVRPTATSEAGLKAAAAENGVGTVVSGAYYMDADSVRLQSRVTNVAGWTVVRAVAPVSASRAAPSTLLEPLRQRVLAVLAVEHDPRFAALKIGAPPPTYEAYEQYLAGIDVFERGDFAGSLPYYIRAAALDSSYVQPLIRAADAYTLLARFADADTLVGLLERRIESLTPADRANVARLRGEIAGDQMANLAGARAAAAATPGAQLPHFQQAISALKANLPHEALAAAAAAPSFGRSRTVLVAGTYWGVVTSAHHMLGDYTGELESAGAGRKFSPESREILGDELRALAALDRLDELRPKLDELEGMPPPEPRSSIPALLISLAQELDAHGHAASSRQVLQRALTWMRARSPEEQRTVAARYSLARAQYLLGQYDVAGRLFAALAADAPTNRAYVLQLGLVAAHRGRRADAEQVDARLRTGKGMYDHGQTPYARARLAATLGDRDGALALLRQSLLEGMTYSELHADPDLASLRTDRRFQELVKPRG